MANDALRPTVEGVSEYDDDRAMFCVAKMLAALEMTTGQHLSRIPYAWLRRFVVSEIARERERCARVLIDGEFDHADVYAAAIRRAPSSVGRIGYLNDVERPPQGASGP